MLQNLAKSPIRDSQECQSAIIRMCIWLFMAVMLGTAHFVGDYDFPWQHYLLLFGFHLPLYLGLLISSVLRPALWPARTYLGILADLSGTTGAIYLTGDATGPFYLLYAVSFLSQGMRYGPTNLLLASIGSLLAYVAVAAILGDWQAQTLEVTFVSIALVVLPAYEYSLLRRLQTAKATAESASSARGAFLATMTHELRTPLSGVIGMTGLLKRTRLDNEQTEYVESINTSADVLQGLVGDILDLSKIDAGKLDLKPVAFRLRDAINETCWALSNQPLDKGVDLICRVAPDLPEPVYGDELRFRQVLYNLIGNAAKFTEQGSICVTARCASADQQLPEPHLEVLIQDSGIGIAADRLAHVFDTFWQADPSTTRRFGGTGLGTAIARDLTQLMGGAIGVKSTLEQGSTFWVKLPFLRVTDSAPPSPPAALRGVQALIFEPQTESAAAIAEACEAAGMTTAVIPDLDRVDVLGSQAESSVQRLALVVDSPSGAALEQIAGQARRRLGDHLPVVYLHYPRRKRLFTDDAAGRAFKPIDAPQLWQVMTEELGPGEASASVAEEPLPSAAAQPGRGRLLVAEDDDINAKLVDTLLRREGCEVTLVHDGQAALEAARSQQFDLAFIDLRMPRMDGIGFTTAYRAQERPGHHLPIVALTANAAEEVRAECLRAGMDDFVTKPIDPELLQELISRYGLGCQAS